MIKRAIVFNAISNKILKIGIITSNPKINDKIIVSVVVSILINFLFIKVIWIAGFEPATPWSQTTCTTKLCYIQ